MKANLIKTLKNNAELVDIEAGRSARANFPGVNFENAVLIINGKIAEPDTIIQDNDIVTLRQIPADLSETPWWVSTFIIPFGFLIQPIQLGIKAQEQAAAAQRELDKIKKLTNAPTIDNSPFLRGTTNAIATGKSQPYLCGRNFMTPYLFANPYYKVAGTDGVDQYVYQIFEAGFKDIVFHKFGIGDTIIKELDDTFPQNAVLTINDGTFAEGVIEIRQNGNLFSTLTELNTKTVSTVANKQIPKAASTPTDYFTFTLDPNASDIEICVNFPYGLYSYNANNDIVDEEVELVFQYSLDGGEEWERFNLDGGKKVKRHETKSLRFLAHHTFTLEDYSTLHSYGKNAILIRVTEIGSTDSKHKNECYVYYYQSKCFDPLKSSTPAGVLNDGGAAGLVPCLNVEARERALSCVIGLKLKATANNESKLSQFNYVATSTARTWNGSAWSEGKSPTRNPAAIALEILTSDTHPASRYADSEIDLDAFGYLYEYCETNNLKFDYVITQNQKKDSTLQIIADVCGCAFYKDIYGRRSVAIDEEKLSPIAVYNPQNIISLSNKKSFTRRVDALRVKYIDSTNDTYKENTYTVTRVVNGQPVTIDENSIIKEVTATGITTHEQIVKYARRLMAIDELRTITTTLKIGFEGVYYTPYSKIAIQDPSITRDAQDAIIDHATYQYGLLKKIYLKKPVNFADPLKIYGIVINTIGSNGAVPIALKVEGVGFTNELDVIDTYSMSETAQPEYGNIASFGELDNDGHFSKVIHEFIITRISRADGGFNLDLQEYNPGVYAPGVIPPYKPIINNTPTPAAGTIPPEMLTAQDVEQMVAGVNADAVQAAVDTIQNNYRFTNIYRVRPVEMSVEDLIAMADDTARQCSAGISVTADEILLQVENVEKELVGMISVQAGSVAAIVEGGGAAGEMSLSLNLPILINAQKRAQFIAASTAEKVNAVYAQIEDSDTYGIKGNASNAAVKALWDDAVAAGLLASQIILSADQLNIAGKTVYTASKSDTDRNQLITAISQDPRQGHTVIDGGYLKTALIEVNKLLAQNITLDANGFIQSSNYVETSSGDPGAGFKIDAANNIIKAYNMRAQGGTFKDINVNGGSFTNITAQGGTFTNVAVKGELKSTSWDSIGEGYYFKTNSDTGKGEGICDVLYTDFIAPHYYNASWGSIKIGGGIDTSGIRLNSFRKYTDWVTLFNAYKTNTDLNNNIMICSGKIGDVTIDRLAVSTLWNEGILIQTKVKAYRYGDEVYSYTSPDYTHVIPTDTLNVMY